MKAFADDKINFAQMMISDYDWKENIFGKGENAGYLFSPPRMYSIGYVFRVVNPLPDDKILDWSKLKQFADDNSKFDENSRKFSKLVENTVGKGEIAQKGP